MPSLSLTASFVEGSKKSGERLHHSCADGVIRPGCRGRKTIESFKPCRYVGALCRDSITSRCMRRVTDPSPQELCQPCVEIEDVKEDSSS